MSLEVLLLSGVVALACVVAFLVLRGRRVRTPEAVDEAKRARDAVDTVIGWPPEVTRLMTGGERAAYEVLVKALPECMVFAQVPLARFVKVPRRHSYAEWLTRAGHLCADFVICDRASLVIGAVLFRSVNDSERSGRRQARLTRVLKAGGVKVFVWREEALPSAQLARDQITQRTGVPSTETPPIEVTEPKPLQDRAHGRIPVPEVVAEVDDHSPRLEPPSSTWFDDLDSGRVPLDPTRRPQGPTGVR
jgi:hypothetical protein